MNLLLRMIFLIFSCYFLTPVHAVERENKMSLKLESHDFFHFGEIPRRFTCDGENISPALSWSNLPKNTKSLVLIVDDPDAPDPANPKGTWVHWVLYNLPATSGGLPQNVAEKSLPAGSLLGKNDFNRTEYGGPCPPVGRHHYFHKLYALDIQLPNLNLPNKKELEAAMAGHIIGQAELIGTFQR